MQAKPTLRDWVNCKKRTNNLYPPDWVWAKPTLRDWVNCKTYDLICKIAMSGETDLEGLG